ncbi:hypothetical protein [Leifsonia xyli]|uniref:hypothetical protein n=1 Tax=Leifsonia xyli TaxID=1575 RepID=UPI0009DC121F|nr:hypothetical protein [Leifsonia xyli]
MHRAIPPTTRSTTTRPAAPSPRKALDNTVSVIDVASQKVTDTLQVGKSPAGVAVAPNGETVYVANQDDNTVSVIPGSAS